MSQTTQPPPTDAPATTAPASRPRLERPRDGRVVAGVGAGVARHLGIDTMLVRIALVVLSFIGGAGVLAYLAGLLLIPDEGEERPLARTGRFDDDRTPFLVGGLLLVAILVGAGPLPWGVWDDGGWLVVLLVGALLVWLATRGDDRPRGATTTAPASAVEEATAEHGDASTAPQGAIPDPPSRGPGRLAAGATLLALGGVGLVLAATGTDLPVDLALALAVLVCGAVALVLAPFGGARGVVTLGFLLAIVASVVAVTDIELRGGVGERLKEPATAAAIPDDPYRLAIGSLVIDLRDTEFPVGVTEVQARSGIGEIIVRTPPDVTVRARARAGVGEAIALGVTEDGGGADSRAVSTRRFARRVVVDARVGIGQVRIEQTSSAREAG